MKKSNQKIICRSIMKTDIKGFSNKVGLLDDLELSKLLNEHKNFIKQKVTKSYAGKNVAFLNQIGIPEQYGIFFAMGMGWVSHPPKNGEISL